MNKQIINSSLSDSEKFELINSTEEKLWFNDVCEAFDCALKKFPSNNLLNVNEDTFTYSETAAEINTLSKQLSSMNIKPGDRVGILATRSALYLVEAMSILSIGAVYVPLDLDLPLNRIEYMLENAEVNACIVTKEIDAEYKDTIESVCKYGCILYEPMKIKNEAQYLNYLKCDNKNAACIL